MIMAELHGKLSEEASSIDTSEDVLTSNVFQCLRYLKPNDGIVPFLNAVFRDNGYKEAENKLDRTLEWEVDYYFWPVGVERKREPDVLIYLKTGQTKYIIVVEAKYYSGPSDKEDFDEESQKQFGNQLSDQYIDLLKRKYRVTNKTVDLECDNENCYLLYLTKNFTKPKPEMDAAIEQYQQNFPNSKINIAEHLMWTNWTKIWSLLSSNPIESFPQNLVRNDLLALLERKGFKEFSGFSIRDWKKQFTSFYEEIWFRLDSKSYDKKNAQFYYELWFQGLEETFFQKLDRNPNFFGEVK